MKKNNILNLNEIIEKCDGKNFLGFACTPWHAHGIDCILCEFSKSGIILNGYIVISAPSANSIDFLIDETNFAYTGEHNIEFIYHMISTIRSGYISEVYKQLLYSLKKDRIGELFYLVKSKEPAFDISNMLEHKYPTVCVSHIVVDEGLGTYIYSTKDCGNSLKSRIFSKAKESIKSILMRLSLQNKSQITFNTLFLKQENEKLDVNARVASLYKEVFENIIAKHDIKTSYGDKIIIVTQNFSEQGLVNNNADLDIIKAIVKQLEKKGYLNKIIIKPHPREKNMRKYSDLGVNVDNDFSSSFELLMAASTEKPKAVIGFSSTALVTANIFWGIKVFSLCEMISYDDMRNDNAVVFKQFEEAFSKYINFINDTNIMEL